MPEVAKGLVKYAAVAAVVIGATAIGLAWLGHRRRGGTDPGGTTPLAGATTTPVASPTAAQPPARAVTLFFADPEGRGLVSTDAEVGTTGDPATEAAAAVRSLLAGPPEDAELLRVLPEGVALRSLYLDGKGTAFVDLSGLGGQPLGGTFGELIAAYALTDTLAFSFPDEVKRVRLLLDGQETPTLAGHVAIEAALTPRRDLVVGSL